MRRSVQAGKRESERGAGRCRKPQNYIYPVGVAKGKKAQQKQRRKKESWFLRSDSTSSGAGRFREPLSKSANLNNTEVRVRAAEVYQAPNIPPNATGFRIGLEDAGGTIGWVDVNDVGSLPRPFDRRAFDGETKTMLSTFRFPVHCFQASNRKLRVGAIKAIHLGLDRRDERPIAFDDLEIVKI